MKDFMVEFTITGDPSFEQFQALLPAEKERIEQLLQSGEIKGIWLKEDYSGGYFIAHKKDEKALEELFESLPLVPFLSFKSFQLKIQ